MAGEATIDRISIDIEADAKKAASEINRLANAVSKLESVSASISNLEKLDASISGLSSKLKDVDFSKLTGLKNLKFDEKTGKNLKAVVAAFGTSDPAAMKESVDAIKGLSGIKVSSTLKNNLDGLVEAVKKIPADLTGLKEVSRAVKNLDGAKLSSTVVKNLEMLPEKLKGFGSLEVESITGKIRALTNALSPMLLRIQSAGPAMSSLNSILRQFGFQTDRAKASANSMTSAIQRQNSQIASSQGLWGRLGATVGTIRTKYVAMAAGFAAVRSGFMRVIEPTNQYVEDMNLFAASMGEAAESAEVFARKCQDLMGIDMAQFARNQGIFQTLITGMGVASEKADVMSQQMTQLGYDIASFYNINVDDAMLKIQSGIAGELEPLRRLGWDLSDARMNLELTRLGIEASTKDMTQAEKVALRYYLIMNQVTTTHGDMARTIASPANQLRVLQAQVTLAARAIGNLFIPALNMILPVVIAVVKAVRLLAQAIANFFGIDATFEVDYSSLDTSGITSGAGAFDDMGNSADKAKDKVKELKNTVMGFDELNKLQATDDGSGKGDKNGNGAGIGLDLPVDTYDFFEGLTDQISAKTDAMAQAIIDSLGRIMPLVAAVGSAIAAWKLGKFLSDLALANPALKKVLNNVGKIAWAAAGLVGVAGEVYYAMDAWNNGLDWLNLIGMIGSTGVAALGLGMAFGPMGAAAGAAFGVFAIGINGMKDFVENGPSFESALAMFIMTPIEGILSLIPGVQDAFHGFASTMSGFWQGFGATWSAFFQKLPEDPAAAFGILLDGFNSWTNDVNAWGQETSAWWQELFGGLESTVNAWGDETWRAITGFCDDVSASFMDWQSDVSQWWQGLFDGLKDTVNTWGESVSGKWDEVCTKASQVGQSIGSFLSDPVGNIKAAWAGVSGWFSANIIHPLTSAFWAIPNGIKAAMNAVIGAINSLNISIPEPVASAVGFSRIGFNVPYLAKGGQVDTGQLFVARESGPELVGTMGGKSTVANNQQIVDGIEAGVYNAVIQALAVGGGSRDDGGSVEIPVYIDSQELARAVFKKADVLARRGELKPVFA